MKKSTFCAILIALILVSLAAFAPMYLQNTVNTASDLTEEQQIPEPMYTIRVYNNMLAVCRGTSSTPYQVTDIHISSLREYDQKLMEQGFPLYSQKDLTMFLEDYGS